MDRNDRARRSRAPALLAWPVLALGLALTVGLVGGVARANIESMIIEEPRSYALFIGDQFTRVIRIDVAPGWKLDEAALPAPGEMNHWVSLVSVDLGDSQGLTQIALTYRLNNAVSAGEVSEQRVLPSWELSTVRADRRVPSNVPEWSFTQLAVVPASDAQFLSAADVRADAPPRPAPWSAHFVRLTLVGLAVVVLALYLFYCHYGAVWLARWRRPFTSALRDLRALASRAARSGQDARAQEAGLRRFHAAVNEAAGHVVLRDDLEAFLRAQPLYAPERQALTHIFEHSHQFFFTDDGERSPMSAQQLVGVCRRLSVLELSAP